MKRPLLWIIVGANLAGLIALAFVFPAAMVSPGALMPAHARLEGECFACHAPFQGVASDRCAKCHAVADIGLRTTSGAPIVPATGEPTRPGIGASFHQALTEPNCGACHTDHGRSTQGRFSHALLPAATIADCARCHTAPENDIHRDLSVRCNQCHTTEHWSPAAFDHAALPSATLARCESCHSAPTDAMHRQITNTCTSCHSPEGWKPATFDHDRYFVLDRDHNVRCETCHTNNDLTQYSCYGCHEHTPAKMRAKHEREGIRDFEDCASCHRSADDHEGGRGEGRRREDAPKRGKEKKHGDDD